MGRELELAEIETVEGVIVEEWWLERERIADEIDWHEDCGHYHRGDTCPQVPCGDYRCCIN